jgi:hypothetical protein
MSRSSGVACKRRRSLIFNQFEKAVNNDIQMLSLEKRQRCFSASISKWMEAARRTPL